MDATARIRQKEGGGRERLYAIPDAGGRVGREDVWEKLFDRVDWLPLLPSLTLGDRIGQAMQARHIGNWSNMWREGLEGAS